MIEFWILARAAALSQLKFLAFLSETCFYYSLTGAGLFLLFGLAAVAAVSPRRTWLDHFKNFQLVIAAGIVIGQELYFSRLASLLPPAGWHMDSKLLLQNALWLSYCLFLFAALIFIAWALEKRLGAKPRLLILKGILLSLAAVFPGPRL